MASPQGGGGGGEGVTDQLSLRNFGKTDCGKHVLVTYRS